MGDRRAVAGRAVAGIVFAGVLALSRPASAAPEKPAPANAGRPTLEDVERGVADLQRDVALLKGDSALAAEVLRLRGEVERLQKQKADPVTPRDWKVEVAPWILLAVVGAAFAGAWYFGNTSADRVREAEALAKKEEARARWAKLELELLLEAVKHTNGPEVASRLRERIDALFGEVARLATEVRQSAPPPGTAKDGGPAS